MILIVYIFLSFLLNFAHVNFVLSTTLVLSGVNLVLFLRILTSLFQKNTGNCDTMKRGETYHDSSSDWRNAVKYV